MRTDISIWCKACLVCTICCPSRPIRIPLTPILVAGPFDRIGVDIIQFPQSYNGNKYAESVDAAVESARTEPIVRESPCEKATPVPRELLVNSPWHGRFRARKRAGMYWTPIGEEEKAHPSQGVNYGSTIFLSLSQPKGIRYFI